MKGRKHSFSPCRLVDQKALSCPLWDHNTREAGQREGDVNARAAWGPVCCRWAPSTAVAARTHGGTRGSVSRQRRG